MFWNAVGTHEIFQNQKNNMNSLYLLVNFFTISIPFVYSFHPKIRFHRHWPAFILASIVVAIPFVIWDGIFTSQGVWGFNERYITGIHLFNLPLEEVLFFICIPFSCVFTYFCLEKFYGLRWNPLLENAFCLIFSGALIVLGFLFIDRIYTTITFLSTGLVCLFLRFVFKVDWFGKATLVYGILLLPFFIVNGVLTGAGLEEPVVWYDNTENLGLRMYTIPVEDAFYGFELILLNILLFKWFQKRFAKN